MPAGDLAAALASARQTARTLQADNARIRREVQARNVFLTRLSHELRAPLNAVIGFADLLAAGVVPVDSPQRVQYLGHIRDRGLHLLRLINDVLDLSRLDAGDDVPYPEPVDLHRLIVGVVDVLHTRIVRKSLVVTVEVAPELRPVVADAPRLKQALAGLLGHAVRVSPESGRIEVHVRPQGGERFRLVVQDSGPGVAPQRLASVFDAFADLAAAAAAEGAPAHPAEDTGLGLALARRLVEAQGGSVGVQSVPGQGTGLFLELPCMPAGYRAEEERARVVEAMAAATTSACGDGASE